MKEKIRNLLLTAIMVLATATVWAQEQTKTLVIERNDGTTAAFALADSPVLSFSNGEMTAKSSKAEVTIALADIANYHFADVATGIDRITGSPFGNGNAAFGNLKAGDKVEIFTIGGQRIGSFTATADGRIGIDMAQYGRGVLILRTSHGSYKFINK